MRKVALRLLVLVIVGAALAVGILAYKANQRAALGRQFLQEFKADLSRAPLDAQGRSYVEGLADLYHQQAFEESFGPDAPTIGGTASANLYQRQLVQLILGQASKDGSTAVVKAMEEYRKTESTLDLTGDR
jgi:hypothetical protein